MPMKRKGGLVRCAQCGHIMVYINSKNCTDLYMQLFCVCDSCGCVDIIRRKTDNGFKSAERTPGFVDRIYVCEDCGKPLFSIVPDRLKNFSFSVRCTCGSEYGMRDGFCKRLGETLDRI